MKIIISESQLDRLITESFEFGGVRIKETVVPTYSKDEYDLTMLYYRFMTNAYKFFIGIKQKFLDKFPLSGNKTEFADEEIKKYSDKWSQMSNEFNSSLEKYNGKMNELLFILNNYKNSTLKETVTGNGIIRFEPSLNKTTLVGVNEVPSTGESGVVYFWNCYCTKDWLLIKPVLLKQPVYVDELPPSKFDYDKLVGEVTDDEGNKTTVYTSSDDCQKAMLEYEEQMKIYKENESMIDVQVGYQNSYAKEQNDWVDEKRAKGDFSYNKEKILTKNGYKQTYFKKFPKGWFENVKITKKGRYVIANYHGLPNGFITNELFLKNFKNKYKPTHWDFGDSGSGIFLVIYPKPIKPICDIPKMKPVIPTFEKTEEFVPFVPPTNFAKSNPQQIQTLPKGNTTYDSSVFGPAKSLIGFMRGRDFIPATGNYTIGMNKQDKELLDNKVELNKYLKNLYMGYANPVN